MKLRYYIGIVFLMLIVLSGCNYQSTVQDAFKTVEAENQQNDAAEKERRTNGDSSSEVSQDKLTSEERAIENNLTDEEKEAREQHAIDEENNAVMNRPYFDLDVQTYLSYLEKGQGVTIKQVYDSQTYEIKHLGTNVVEYVFTKKVGEVDKISNVQIVIEKSYKKNKEFAIQCVDSFLMYKGETDKSLDQLTNIRQLEDYHLIVMNNEIEINVENNNGEITGFQIYPLKSDLGHNQEGILIIDTK